MSETKGNLSINSENIFPIIKKWLYSDHDIFYRELVSNGCDAITKLKKLEMMGECELPSDYEPKISVVVDPASKSIRIADNGLGMDEDEVKEYINQIAFSGASAFLEKYKDRANEDQIIGHFGLGFYSAFMVADKVHIDTKSYKKDSTAVHWECDGGSEYTMSDGDLSEVGTVITLFLNEDCLEFANEYRAREVLDKYCSFMPYPIYLEKEGEEQKKDDEGNLIPITPINDTTPLWAKTPADCTDEEYKDFYRKVFNDFKEPLFWIHLNMDYPFNLKGILYFPKINSEYESLEGTIKLYNNQVFIADNIKEVIPEFLLLLKGTIDCPDLPLNVSRSALQNDGFVKKISDYITKKVADKLVGMCKTDRENYEKYWDDINPFVKYGCLKEDKFLEKVNDYVLFKDINDEYITLPDLLVKPQEPEESKDNDSEKPEGSDSVDSQENPEDTKQTIYYVTDVNTQSQYIKAFKDQNMNAVILDNVIDTNFITQLEMRNQHYKFERVDSGVENALMEESGEELKDTEEALSKIFQKELSNENLTVKVVKLKDESISSMITISETNRRMADMMKVYAMPGMDMGNMFGKEESLVLNAGNELVKYIFNNPDSEHIGDFCNQIYDLALMANEPLSPERMNGFIQRSNKIMLLLTK